MALPGIQSILPLLPALSAGASLVRARSQEQDYRKGVNPLFASLTLSAQWSCVCIVALKILEQLPYSRWIWGLKIGLQVTPLINFVGMPFLGLLHAELYPNFYSGLQLAKQSINHELKEKPLEFSEKVRLWLLRRIVRPLMEPFPEKFSPTALKVASFFSQHLGNLAEIALWMESLALVKLQKRLYAAFLIAPLLYYHLSPYLPAVLGERFSADPKTTESLIQFGQLLTGMRLFQIKAIWVLLNQVGRIKTWIDLRLDAEVRSHFKFPHSPTLADIYTPFSTLDTNPSYEEILKIFEKECKVEINFAHCSKGVEGLISEENTDFDQFQLLFNQQDWDYKVVRAKCLDDERFRLYLADLLGKSGTILTPNYDNYLEMIAKKRSRPIERFVTDWFSQRCKSWLEVVKKKSATDSRFKTVMQLIAGYIKTTPHEANTILLQLVVGKHHVKVDHHCLSLVPQEGGEEMSLREMQIEMELQRQHLEHDSSQQQEGVREDKFRTEGIAKELKKEITQKTPTCPSLPDFLECFESHLSKLQKDSEAVMKGAAADARFVKALARELPDQASIKPNYESALAKALAKTKKDEKTVIMEWFKRQMPLFVSKIKRGLSAGSSTDLGRAVNNCKKILPFLLKMQNGAEQDLHDYLVGIGD